MKIEGPVQDDLNRLFHKLITGYSPLRVNLFGSYAYGEPDRDSDLALLIIKESRLPQDWFDKANKDLRRVNALLAISRRLLGGELIFPEILQE